MIDACTLLAHNKLMMYDVFSWMIPKISWFSFFAEKFAIRPYDLVPREFHLDWAADDRWRAQQDSASKTR